ncbi:hypothetical protein [Desulfobacter sp.]|uniref:DUF6364 family protein n=1 Tax=Desulfobacter sp. TaxID=2294 RepID=UPI000E7D9F5C|nr:hypothetical protein [Desulfobacter sp.]HBT89943.1 hypothetical protein [Desulfobacter sp.]
MPNITISLDTELLHSGREYAKQHQTSLNALIRKLLERTVVPQSIEWIDSCFELMDRAKADSNGRTWNRDDLYDR